MQNAPHPGPASSGEPSSSLPRRPRGNNTWLWLVVIISVMTLLLMVMKRGNVEEVNYTFFWQQLEAHNVVAVRFEGARLYGEFHEPPTLRVGEGEAATIRTLPKRFVVQLPPAAVQSEALLERLRATPEGKPPVRIEAEEPADSTGMLILSSLLMTALLVGVIVFVYRRTQSQLAGGGFLGGFGKSPARRYEAGKTRVTFADVAGLDNVKNDLQEIVEFLKNPEKFRRLGARIPKGTLLMGPPGTGKTLLARAVAGEAGVPFFSINGSEFIQMFVGVGASRVRDLFQTAKENAPCILFIDEIDAVGRVRGAGLGGGHDEREQTLNQILSEMDGFTPYEAVIVLAATNRPDVLDPALLRPGRFDRHITVDRPNLRGRLELFKVHTREVPLADDVSFEDLAHGTVGLTGADIRNIVNEAALLAARLGKQAVDMKDFEQARDKVLMGPKRDEVLSGREKQITAYHEAGHALLAWIVPGVDRVHKVTIIPRGRSLGATQILPDEDRLNIGESQLNARLTFVLAGRAAEKLVFHEYSAGAEDDLKRATQLARRMVTAWGMSERLGPVNYQTSEEHPFLGKEIHEHREFSDYTAQVIDEEVARILNAAARRATELLSANRKKLDRLAEALLEHEELVDEQLEALIGPSPNRLLESNGQPALHQDAKAGAAATAAPHDHEA
jgi:cell division protease FtsH